MNLQEVDLKDIYRRWKSNLGAFQGFFRSTPFVSLQTYEDFKLDFNVKQEIREEILRNVLKNCSKNMFLILDLPFNEILDLALELNNKYSIKPILNINMLFHPFGIVGNKDNINKLINNGLALKKINTNKYVMLLDYDRYYNNLDIDSYNDKLNNQYIVGCDDLPYLDLLKHLKYEKIIVVTKEPIKDDLNEYIEYINGDIFVDIIKVR